MIQIIDTSGVLHPISNYERLHITHKQDGNDVCSFILNTSLPEYSLIREEAVVRTHENEYLIKKIDDDRIDCKLNFDFLKHQFYKSFVSRTKTLSEVLAAHLPQGWTVQGANVTAIQRSIKFDFCSDYDVVMACPDTYNVKFIWHILEKRLVVVKPELMNPTGEYVTSDLNLRKLSFKGQSVNFATRLYAYGKDGMTMEEAIVDGQRYGLEYVDNNTYSDKIIVAYWKDERYTVPDNLYDDAVIRLAALSQPTRSYECRIDDLAKRDERYRFLDFAMHKVISLLDSERKIAVNHQIVEYDEWPDEPEQNNVTLSCVTETIQETIHTVAQQIHDEIDEYKETVKAEFAVQDDRISAKVSKTGGTHSSFGWELTDLAHTWYSNNVPVMSIDGTNGLHVSGSGTFTGEIRASSGYIGNSVNGFTISSRAIANGMTSLADTDHNGVYVGTDGIALGKGKFKVTNAGAVTASNLALSGGSISIGKDSQNNPVFNVTSTGAVTASNLTLTGGSINIKNGNNSIFSVSSNGYINADFTGGSLKIGDKFNLSSTGALTAGGFTIGNGAIYSSGQSSYSGTGEGVHLSSNGIRLGDAFKVSKAGAVTASALTLTGGTINIADRFKVSQTGYLTADFTGGSITLGKDSNNNPVFQVTNSGAVTAKSLSLTGGSIQLGDDGNGHPVFAVTNAGAVTAKNLTLTGGSINIADKFKVSSSGVLTANMTGGSIALGQNFAVTNTGAVTAKNLTLTGGSISLGDDGTEQHNPVFRVTNAGAVTAKDLTLTGGSINIGNKFKVSTTGVLTADMTGGSITLGENFAVTSTGAVTAKNLTLSGGSIALGNDGNNNPVFSVTSGGAVTAKNLALTGGSINIKDGNGDTAFSVSNTGAVTASNLSITGGSISINNGAFRVDADGNLHANSGSFGGTVNAENIQSTGVQGTGGYLSGSAISQQSIPANRVGNNVLTTGQFASGVNSSLGYANAYNSATQQGTNTYPAYFSAGQVVARSSFYSGTYYIALAGDTEGTINNHTHQISADSNGVVTIGAPDFLGNPHSFNIADTAFYKAAISAREITAITASRETTDANVVWNSTSKTIGASYTLTAKHNSTVLGTEREYSITIPATKAYNAGQDYGAGTVSVLGTSYLTTTVKNSHKTSGSHHYVNVDITPTASATKSDGTAQTATNTINRDILADTVYTDGVTAGSNAVSVSSVTRDTYSSTEYDSSVSVENSYARYDSGYMKGRIIVTLSNGQSETVLVSVDGTKAYNAGVTAGESSGAAGVTISSTDVYSYSTSANYSISFDNSYVRYSNGYIKGRATVSLSNGNSSTVFIEMDGARAYEAGAASASASISSVTQASYSTNSDYNVTFDNAYVRYTNGYLGGRATITFSNGNTATLFVQMDAARAYNAGYQAAINSFTVSASLSIDGPDWSNNWNLTANAYGYYTDLSGNQQELTASDTGWASASAAVDWDWLVPKSYDGNIVGYWIDIYYGSDFVVSKQIQADW